MICIDLHAYWINRVVSHNCSATPIKQVYQISLNCDSVCKNWEGLWQLVILWLYLISLRNLAILSLSKLKSLYSFVSSWHPTWISPDSRFNMFSLALFHKLTDIFFCLVINALFKQIRWKKKLAPHYVLCIFQTMSVLNGSDQILKVLYCESLNIIYLTTLIPPS